MGREGGFTLIEIMIVVTIVALMISIGYLGFNQLLVRRSSQDMQSLQHWLQTASDRARLEGAVYGLRIEESQLQLLTYRQGLWLPVLNQQGWHAESDYQLEFELDDSQERRLEISGDEGLQPTLVFLPDGSQWPGGRIHISDPDRDFWIAANDRGQFEWTGP